MENIKKCICCKKDIKGTKIKKYTTSEIIFKCSNCGHEEIEIYKSCSECKKEIKAIKIPGNKFVFNCYDCNIRMIVQDYPYEPRLSKYDD